METSGFLKVGVDISAAASDDSINTSTTSLAGLLQDQWVLASGFSNAANNTWFEAKADASASKLLTLTPPITHLRLPGVSGNYASTPDSVGNSVTGNLELMAKLALSDWTPAANMFIVGKDDGSTNRDYGLQTDASSTGKLVFFYSADGTTLRSATSTVAVSFADLATGFVKATYATGTGVVQFFTSTDGVSYAQLGTNVTLTSGAIHNGAGALTVGARSNGAIPLGGRVYYAEVRNGIGGTIVAALDPTLGARGAVTWTAGTGELWTVNSSGTPPAMLQGAALVTESAGASVTLTGYKRGLGQSYDMEFRCDQADDPGPNFVRTSNRASGGGAPEVLLERIDDSFSVSVFGTSTGLIDDAAAKQWREALGSMAAGETATFDRYGTVASPDNPVQVYLMGDGYKIERISGARLYKVSFDLGVA